MRFCKRTDACIILPAECREDVLRAFQMLHAAKCLAHDIRHHQRLTRKQLGNNAWKRLCCSCCDAVLQICVLQQWQTVLRHVLPERLIGKCNRIQRFAEHALQRKLPAGRLLEIGMFLEVGLPHRLVILILCHVRTPHAFSTLTRQALNSFSSEFGSSASFVR